MAWIRAVASSELRKGCSKKLIPPASDEVIQYLNSLPQSEKEDWVTWMRDDEEITRRLESLPKWKRKRR